MADYAPGGPLAFDREVSTKRPLLCPFGGIGSELRTLSEWGANVNVIVVFEINAAARAVFKDRASRHFPGVPILENVDLRAAECRARWSHEGIARFCDQWGVPIFIAGWCCDGVAGPNRKGGANGR